MSLDQANPRLRYEPALDGMRAFAVTSVVLYHVEASWFPGGWAGVDCFFVVSGYLITRILLQEIQSTGSLGFKRFYMRRILRLMPAFVAMLLAYGALSLVASHDLRNSAEAILMSATYLMDFNRAFGWMGEASLGHTWSLAIEEQFYLLWPIALLLLFRRHALAWLAAATVVVIVWRQWLLMHGAGIDRIYNGFDTHADPLLLGCVLALMQVGAQTRRLARLLAPVPLIAVVGIFLFLPLSMAFTSTVGACASFLTAACILVATFEAGWLQRFLSLPLFTYTGRISYGWYLWHYPLLMVGTRTLHTFWAKPLLVIAAYGVAMASYHWLELPFLRLKSRFQPQPEFAHRQPNPLAEHEYGQPLITG